MAAAVAKNIDKVAKTTTVNHVLFTGHSAGGAVASLMFAKLLSCAEKDCECLEVHFISPKILTVL